MKKSKLLIPALSVASVGAVVAPMVTSCAQTSVVGVIEFETVKTVSGTKKIVDYKPAYTSKSDKYKDEHALVSAYTNAVKNDKKILADDFMNAYSDYLKALTAENLPFTQQKVVVKVHDMDYGFIYSDAITSLLTYDIIVSQVQPDGGVDYKWSLEYNVKNLPYTMYFNGGEAEPQVTTPTIVSTLPFVVTEGGFLALLASGFSVDMKIVVTDPKDELVTDVAVTVNDLATLYQLVVWATTKPTGYIAGLIAPLSLHIVSNYFLNVSKK